MDSRQLKKEFAILALGYVCLLAAMSTICVAAYWWDKRRAALGGRRIPERTLHLLAFFGGWPGALYAQRRFRHKTSKTAFLVVFWFVVVLHLAIVAAAGYLAFQ
jgi:uncharacterized membrane protein YsdA (DUF1294 family)